MKKAKKVLLLVLCALLLVGATIAGTVAYLSDTKTVTNTFTAGNVSIQLKEYDMNPETGELNKQANGVANLVETGINAIKVIPGREIQKQPVVIVNDGSENCWLFVKVANGDATKDVLGSGTFTPAPGWSAVQNEAGWYQYFADAEPDEYQVFKSFTFKTDLSSEAVENLTGGTIVVTAYAIQEEGVDQAAAFAMAKSMAGETTNG